MPDFEAIADTLRSRYETQVATPQSLPVQWDNQPYDPATGTTWSRFAVLPAQGEQITTGVQKRFRHRGLVVASLFTPFEAGDKALWALVDVIVAAFRSLTVSGVHLRTPYPRVPGRTPDGKWWQINVHCPFVADELT